MRSAHAATVAELGDVRIDGPRLAWSDVAKTPTPLVRPWSLDGEFHHDEDCFEINPVTWYTLATCGLAIRGQAPAEVTIAVKADDRLAFVQETAYLDEMILLVAASRA